MEHWRAFFAQADSDLWTIIDQAILLAASDFPAEFRHKRCEIAETLFARRPWPPERSMEATMLSGSVVTNATAYVENHTCRQEVDAPKYVRTSEVEGKVADTYSLGSDSKASAVDRHVLGHDYRSAELDTHPDHHNDTKIDAADMDHSVQQDVSMIKDKIMDATNQSEDEILQSLQALEHLEINVKILKATDIGREVNKFRKHPSGPIRNLAKQLVRTWKSTVDEWVKTAGDVPPLDASAMQGVGKMDGLDPKVQGNPSFNSNKTSMQQPKQQSLLQSSVGAASSGRTHPWGLAAALPRCNDDFSFPGRKISGDHIREEMGSSRVESDELDRPGTLEKRPERSGYPAELCTGGLGPGRPMASIPEVKRAIVSNDVAYEHKDLVEKVRRSQNNQGDLSQKNGHGKFPVVQKLSAADHLQATVERHEVTKRRLPNESQYAENAKKQRDMQTSNRPEPSRGVFVGAKVPTSVKPQHYNLNKW